MAITETLAMVITAEGAQASAVLDDLGAKLTKLNAQSVDTGKAIGTALTVGAVVAGAALVELVKNGVEALQEQQVTAAQTEAALKSTGDAAGVTAQQIEALSQKISAYSGYSIDAIQKTENLLLTFTNIKNTDTAKIFDETTVAVTDMARALGEDATTAATQLGKALNAPDTGLTALQRAGVQFTTAQKDVIKSLFDTGQQAEAQQIILDKVSEKFGGSAKAYGDTTAGALDKVGNSITAVEKTLAAPLLSPLADVLNGVAAGLTDVNKDAPGLIQATALVVGLGAAWVIAEKAIGIYQQLSDGVIATAAKNALGVSAEGAAAATAATEYDTLAASEVAAGAAFDVSGAEASLGLIGGAAVTAGGKVSALLRLLGVSSLGAGAAILGGALSFDPKLSGSTTVTGDPALTKQVNAFEQTLGKTDQLLGGTVLTPDQAKAFIASGGKSFGATVGGIGQAPSTNSPAWQQYINSLNLGNVHDDVNSIGYNPLQSGRDFSTSAAGIYGQDALDDGSGGVDYTAKGGQFYVPPKGSAGSASGALAAANAQATLAALFGLTPDGIAAALDQGIVTGTDPLSQLMSDAGTLLTGTAKTIVGQLSNILDSAIAAGQAAEKSLQFNLSSAQQFGTSTNVTFDANGVRHDQVQSPVLAQLQAQAGLDKRFGADYTKLSKEGLNQDILSQYGPSNIDALDALANSSPSDISAINSADKQVNLLARSVGQQVAQTQYLAQAVGYLYQLLQVLPGSVTTKSLQVVNKAAADAQLRSRTVVKR